MGLFLAALTQPTEPRSQVAAAGAAEGPGVLMGRLPLPVPLGQMHHSSLGLLIKPTLVFLMSSAWSFRATSAMVTKLESMTSPVPLRAFY